MLLLISGVVVCFNDNLGGGAACKRVSVVASKSRTKITERVHTKIERERDE